MEERLLMMKRLLSTPSGQWFKLSDRKDKAIVLEAILELIEAGYKFLLSARRDKFMRASIDLFEWAAGHPEGSEIRVRNLDRIKCYDLYYNGKLIAIK